MSDTDKVFAGSVPKVYEAYLVPLIFEPYAVDLVSRLHSRNLSRVLEIAAGTGVATRALASTLGAGVSIVATDLNPAMLEEASAVGTKRNVGGSKKLPTSPPRQSLAALDHGRWTAKSKHMWSRSKTDDETACSRE